VTFPEKPADVADNAYWGAVEEETVWLIE